MLACRRIRDRHALHVQRLARVDALIAQACELCRRSAVRARRVALVVQLMAAAQGCVCVCTTVSFETACSEQQGKIVQTRSAIMCVAPDGGVLATWTTAVDGGEP